MTCFRKLLRGRRRGCFVKGGGIPRKVWSHKVLNHAASWQTHIPRIGRRSWIIFSQSRSNVSTTLVVEQGDACQSPRYLQLYSACSPESAQTQCRTCENTTTTSCPSPGNSYYLSFGRELWKWPDTQVYRISAFV